MPTFVHPSLGGALRGLKLVSLAPNVPGPVAARELQDMGMEVTKVESPAGDPLHLAYPGWYGRLTHGQKIMPLDLKRSEAQSELNEQLADADVLLTSSRPSALARLGLDPGTIAQRYPRLAYVAITGEGEKPGHDLTYQACLGLVSDGMPRTLAADLMAARVAVQAVLALLFQRERTGKGEYAVVEIPAAAAVLVDPWREGLTRPDGILGGADPLYGIYTGRDGALLALAALEPDFRARVERELGVKDRPGLKAKFQERTAAEWEAWATARDLPLVALKP